MLHSSPASLDWRFLNAITLFKLCAADRGNSDAWSELLRRYTPRLKQFIRGAMRQVSAYAAGGPDSVASDTAQENDFLQNAIVRLVENDCAAMKRFSGSSENELLAYLAVICRSCVLDASRRHHALKRRPGLPATDEARAGSVGRCAGGRNELDREILVRELVSLTHSIIQSDSGNVSNRDQLVFELHFFDGLSLGQIARCEGINLSRAGVERLLKRIIGRVQAVASSDQKEETVQ